MKYKKHNRILVNILIFIMTIKLQEHTIWSKDNKNLINYWIWKKGWKMHVKYLKIKRYINLCELNVNEYAKNNY